MLDVVGVNVAVISLRQRALVLTQAHSETTFARFDTRKVGPSD